MRFVSDACPLSFLCRNDIIIVRQSIKLDSARETVPSSKDVLIPVELDGVALSRTVRTEVKRIMRAFARLWKKATENTIHIIEVITNPLEASPRLEIRSLLVLNNY